MQNYSNSFETLLQTVLVPTFQDRESISILDELQNVSVTGRPNNNTDSTNNNNNNNNNSNNNNNNKIFI